MAVRIEKVVRCQKRESARLFVSRNETACAVIEFVVADNHRVYAQFLHRKHFDIPFVEVELRCALKSVAAVEIKHGNVVALVFRSDFIYQSFRSCDAACIDKTGTVVAVVALSVAVDVFTFLFGSYHRLIVRTVVIEMLA